MVENYPAVDQDQGEVEQEEQKVIDGGGERGPIVELADLEISRDVHSFILPCSDRKCALDGSDVCLFCVLATSKIISGRVSTCDSVHPWTFYRVASLGH